MREQSYSPDIFEYVYFASPHSVVDGISVSKSRQYAGKALARTIQEEVLEICGTSAANEIDCVVPVPETSFHCALAVAQALKKPLAFGLIRNSFVMRTFILPNQKERTRGVLRKLAVVAEEFKGKNVLIIDDSIVRGTTSRHIIRMARDAGANKVYFASGSPAIR